jgi:hypothetical protein
MMRNRWLPFVAFLLAVSLAFGLLVSRRAGTAVGVLMGVLLALLVSAATGIAILWSEGKLRRRSR